MSLFLFIEPEGRSSEVTHELRRPADWLYCGCRGWRHTNGSKLHFEHMTWQSFNFNLKTGFNRFDEENRCCKSSFFYEINAQLSLIRRGFVQYPLVLSHLVKKTSFTSLTCHQPASKSCQSGISVSESHRLACGWIWCPSPFLPPG